MCLLELPVYIETMKLTKDSKEDSGILPQLDEFYFTTAEKKLLEATLFPYNVNVRQLCEKKP
jgi:hypothetical protein